MKNLTFKNSKRKKRKKKIIDVILIGTMEMCSNIINVYKGESSMKEIGEKLVQKQLDAYNAQNLEDFVSVYSEDVIVMEFPSNSIITIGMEEMREGYSRLFKENPKNHAELLTRIVKGNRIIDHEFVTGRTNGIDRQAIAIYEIENEKISKVWFL